MITSVNKAGWHRLVIALPSPAYFPVPCRVTVWGEPPPLSLMASDALRVPVALGVKVIEIVQLCPPARLDPQLLP